MQWFSSGGSRSWACLQDRGKPEEQRLGPVLRRREQVQAGTTDQRLLDTEGDSDWVHTDPWRVMRIQSEFVEGFGALAELPSAISVFGSARTRSARRSTRRASGSAGRWSRPDSR